MVQWVLYYVCGLKLLRRRFAVLDDSEESTTFLVCCKKKPKPMFSKGMEFPVLKELAFFDFSQKKPHGNGGGDGGRGNQSQCLTFVP